MAVIQQPVTGAEPRRREPHRGHGRTATAFPRACTHLLSATTASCEFRRSVNNIDRRPLFLVLTFLSLISRGTRPAAADRSAHGRVSALSGNLLVKGPDDDDWSYLERNAVVSDGDLVWADDDSLAELDMEQGAWLRLGPDTRVDVRRLPPDGDLR